MGDAREIDIRAAIDGAFFGRYQILIIFLCMLVTVFDGYDTQSIGYIAPLMAKDLGLDMASFGPVFAAGLVGLMLGAMAFGAMGDKIGRKWSVMLSVLAYSIFSLLTPLGESFASLLVLRFLAGFGGGGALPNVIALTLEYSPRRLSAFAASVSGSCFSVGSIIGGILSATITAAYGWQVIFYIGGTAPLLVLLAVAVWMPESISFLALKGDSSAAIASILGRITGQAFATTARFLPEPKAPGPTVQHLFQEGRASMTILLWVAFFLNLVVLLLLVEWLPSLLRDGGLPLQTAIATTIAFSIGGVIAALLLGHLMDRFNPYVILGSTFASTALFIAIAANSIASQAILLAAVFLAGAGVNGAQSCLVALSGMLYPTAIRSTGVGWALGIGRIGAIVGPLIGGLLVGLKWDSSSIILTAAAPMLLGALVVRAMSKTRSADWAMIRLGRPKGAPTGRTASPEGQQQT